MEVVNFIASPSYSTPKKLMNMDHNFGYLTPSPQNKLIGQRMLTDTCFSCKKQGHWAKDCPSKLLKRPLSLGPNSPILSDLPVFQCHCGSVCDVKCSSTEKNPNRKFYGCPNKGPGNGCGFFKWCDEICSVQSKVPLCPCGAGRCSVTVVANGENAGRTYFACRIKKGHGACTFFQWADAHLGGIMNEHIDSGRCDNPNGTSNNYFATGVHSNFEVQKRRKLDFPMRERPQHLRDITLFSEGSPGMKKVQGETSGTSRQNEEKSLVIVAAKNFHIMSQAEIQRLQEKFLRKISDAANSSVQDILQIKGINCRDWLGKLVYGPSQSLTSPPLTLSDCGLSPSLKYLFVLPNNNNAFDKKSSPQNQIIELTTAGSWEPICARSLVVSMQGNVKLNKVLGANELIDVVEHTDPHNDRTTTKLASDAIMNQPSVCNNHVLHQHASESSIHNNLSLQDLINQYNSEKVRFDYISNLHAEATASITSFDAQLSELREEASCVNNILEQIENQLVYCEIKSSKLKARADKLAQEKLESERSLQSSESALELCLQREEGRQ